MRQVNLHTKERFLILICMLLGLLVLVPILHRFVAARIFLDVFLTAIALSMLYTVSNQNKYIIYGSLLAVVMLVSQWLQYAYANERIAAIGMIAGVFFSILVMTFILKFVLNAEEVSREIIYASILLYLLGALMFSFIFTFLQLVDPASFRIELVPSQDYLLVFQYFSFVTITTLGYGDIAPATEVAKAFSVLESIVGQLYLVVVVAWLVGMFVSKRTK